jgi:hypothetical protein
MTAALKVLPDGFLRRQGFRAVRTRWSDIQEIEGVAFEKVTYDEDFLIVRTPETSVDVGELDKGFDAFERALLEAFPNFPSDWKRRVEVAGQNCRITLWRRDWTEAPPRRAR